MEKQRDTCVFQKRKNCLKRQESVGIRQFLFHPFNFFCTLGDYNIDGYPDAGIVMEIKEDNDKYSILPKQKLLKKSRCCTFNGV